MFGNDPREHEVETLYHRRTPEMHPRLGCLVVGRQQMKTQPCKHAFLLMSLFHPVESFLLHTQPIYDSKATPCMDLHPVFRHLPDASRRRELLHVHNASHILQRPS